jgi:hypothetical protein
MFLRCPRQYQFRYIEGLKIPPSGALVLGRAWHEAIEHNYSQKIASGCDLPSSEVEGVFADRFDKGLASEEVAFVEGEEPGALKDQGVALTATHHREIAPLVQPAEVESEFRVSLGEDFPYELLGYFDVIDKGGVIIDNKSWGRRKSQEDIDTDLQLTCYALGYRIAKGAPESGLRIDAVIKNKKPVVQQITTSRTNDDCRFLLGLIENVADAIQKGVFYPNPTHNLCSPKWCGYWSKCKSRS